MVCGNLRIGQIQMVVLSRHNESCYNEVSFAGL
jgi:hypothetical protein